MPSEGERAFIIAPHTVYVCVRVSLFGVLIVF